MPFPYKPSYDNNSKFSHHRYSSTRSAGARKHNTPYKYASRTWYVPRALPEYKTVDTLVNLACDDAGALALLNGLQLGLDFSNRIGRQITMCSIEFNGLHFVTPATGVDQQVRTIVFIDKQTNGAAPVITDLLVSSSPNSLRNLNGRSRFVIMMDKRICLSASAEDTSQVNFKFYKRISVPAIYNAGNAGTVADIVSGSVYVITMSNIPAGVTAGSMSGRVRIRYTDQ